MWLNIITNKDVIYLVQGTVGLLLVTHTRLKWYQSGFLTLSKNASINDVIMLNVFEQELCLEVSYSLSSVMSLIAFL